MLIRNPRQGERCENYGLPHGQAVYKFVEIDKSMFRAFVSKERNFREKRHDGETRAVANGIVRRVETHRAWTTAKEAQAAR
jgi:hypothetical protein